MSPPTGWPSGWSAANRDGHLLCPGGKLPPDELGLPDNNYPVPRARSARGRLPARQPCPPRQPARRARADGGGAADPARRREQPPHPAPRPQVRAQDRRPSTDDGEDRGLLFICLNTDIARQFEFVQQTWLLNPDFATLFEETDPLVGPDGRMTIREEPLRRTVHVETFVQMAGGDYFFLPSLPALRYLAML